MKKTCLPALLLGLLFLACSHASAQPALRIQLQDRQSIQISWPATVTDFTVEQTSTLGAAANWQTVNASPLLQNNRLTVTLPSLSTAQFFRLRQFQSPTLTSITATSPVDGETGVAVTRETIVQFNGVLAANAVIKTNNFYATAAGRKILSRTELSSDRTKATLFYLEPLPGSARVNVFFDAEGLTDAQGQRLDPAGTGTPNGLKVFSFETLSLTPLTGTAVIGRVFASELVPGPDTGTNAVNKPLAGVTITVDGMEQTIRAVTDAQGNFTLTNTPAGRFFVHIDGRTVVDAAAGIHYPDKAYYPFVGKAWDAVAGRTDNKAGGTGVVFLPLIAAGTLQPVSMTQDTPISFPASVVAANPALAGVTITVPANALFSDDGTRGGKVGIAPVPPDRLPGPLPAGLELPIVITVQSDGPLNFDKPAPICFPNLPDPVLKTPLPAGSQQALIVFNHKKGIWETVGRMTVSADGKFICSDPGVGILQPGWVGCGPIPLKPPKPPLPLNPPKPPPRPPRGPQCPPDEAAVKKCEDECRYQFLLCKKPIDDWLAKAFDLCRHLGEGTGLDFSDLINPCNNRASDRTYLAILICRDQEIECFKECEPCKKPHAAQIGRNPRSVRPAEVGDPLRDQIEALFDQILPLLYQTQEVANPAPEVLNQIEQLASQADQLAGGDALAYLQAKEIADEEDAAAYAHSLGWEPEDLEAANGPPYPVLYAATVVRPSGIITLRGETEPYGDYDLFLPRDGTLLNVDFYDPRTKSFGTISPHLRPGAKFLPPIYLVPLPSDAHDRDQDGLADFVENIYGTDPKNPDSDGDGIPDGAEVNQGTNPLDGVPIRTGIVGTARTPAGAVDVAAANDLLAVAEGSGGVALFSIVNPMNPVLTAQVDTPGTAQAVAISGNLVAVATGDRGLSIIDATDPSKAQIVHQVRMNGSAQGVITAGPVAYVGLKTQDSANSGAIATIDLIRGAILDSFSFGAGIFNGQQISGDGFNDLSVSGDELYVLTPLGLRVYRAGGARLELIARLPVPGQASGLLRRLFVGGGLAYICQFTGYSVVDVRDPAKPILIAQPPAGQFTIKYPTVNGSGSMLAAAFLGTSFGVSLYDTSEPTDVTRYLTSFKTPSSAQALTIHNGLAYVTDSSPGIQVINYLPFDRDGKAPVMTLSTSAINGSVEAGATLRVTANATDDVQVRNVEFYVDGVKAFSDGNFPFEFRFVAPALTAVKTNLTVRARAVDTGGNFTWSDEVTITLSPDKTPPRVLASAPLGGTKTLTDLSASFSEPMDPATLNAASFQLIAAGADGVLDTADDLPVTGGVVSYRADLVQATLSFGTPLPVGLYRAVVTTAAADPVGNRLAEEYRWELRVANAVFWNQRIDGNWDDAFNWSTGAVPGPNDDVLIESIPGVTVIIGSGVTATIKTLFLQEPVLMNGGTLKGGRVAQTANGKLIFASSSASTLDGMNIEGDLELTNTAAKVAIRNGLILAGHVLLDHAGSITFQGDQTFDSAQIVFGDSGGALGIEGSATLTLGPSSLIRGKSGVIGGGLFLANGTKKLINQGVISADVPGGRLTIFPTQFENAGTLESKNGGSVYIFQGAQGDLRNTGQINASSGGTLTLSGTWHNLGSINANDATINLGGAFSLADVGKLNRSGGTINLTGVLDLGGGTMTLDSATGPWRVDGGTLKSGTLKLSDPTNLFFAANANTLDAMHVEGGLVLTNTGARALIRNGLTLPGTVLLDNAGGITFLGDQTFDNAQIVFGVTGGALGIEGSATLTLGPAILIRGKSGVIGAGVFSNGGNGTKKLINQGVISADVPGGRLTISPTQFENTGTIECKNGGSLYVFNGLSDLRNIGQINASSGGTLTLSGTWHNLGSINANDATVNLGGAFSLADIGKLNRSGGTINLTGVLDLGGATLTLDSATGPWRVDGGTLKSGTVRVSDPAKLLFAANGQNILDAMRVEGDLDLTTGNARAQIHNGLTLTGTALLDKTGAITFVGDQTFNAGHVVFAGLSNLGIEPGTKLTFGADVVVRGKDGIIGNSVVFFAVSGTRKLINQGLIAADVPGGMVTISPTEFENPGTLRADGTGASVLVRVTGFTNTGKIEELNGGKVLINP